MDCELSYQDWSTLKCSGKCVLQRSYNKISIPFYNQSQIHQEAKMTIGHKKENKPRITPATAYIIRERNYLYQYKLPG